MMTVIVPVMAMVVMMAMDGYGVDTYAYGRCGIVGRIIGIRDCDAASQSHHRNRSYDQLFHGRSSFV